MSKRPLCAFALLFMAVIWCLSLAGVPFFGNAPPVLPEGCSPDGAVLEGRVYETKNNSFYTILYLRQVKILSDSNQYSMEQVKVNIKNDAGYESAPYRGPAADSPAIQPGTVQ